MRLSREGSIFAVSDAVAPRGAPSTRSPGVGARRHSASVRRGGGGRRQDRSLSPIPRPQRETGKTAALFILSRPVDMQPPPAGSMRGLPSSSGKRARNHLAKAGVGDLHEILHSTPRRRRQPRRLCRPCRKRDDRADEVRRGRAIGQFGDAVRGDPFDGGYRQPGAPALRQPPRAPARGRQPPFRLRPRTLLLGLRGGDPDLRHRRRRVDLRGPAQARSACAGLVDGR